MFSHLRYLSFISFIIVLATSLFVGGYFRFLVSNGIIKDTVEKNAVALERFFIKNISEHNPELVKKLAQQNIAALQSNKDLIQEVIRYAADMPVISFKLYTSKGDLILSSNSLQVKPREHAAYSMAALAERFFSSADREEGFSLARSGIVHSRIIPYAAVAKPDNSTQNMAVIETFIPVFSGSSQGSFSKADMVIEIFSDITALWRYLFYFQVMGTLGVIVIFSVLYSVLFYSFAKVHAMLEKRHGILSWDHIDNRREH